MVRVSLRQVTKRFGANTAVDHVDLDIGAGELFFLLGPSGCGKTTCLRIVAGFYRTEEGELRFNDRSVNDVPPHQRNTGMVFQNYALWPHMTVYRNVEYGLKVRHVEPDERRRQVLEALEVVQLAEYAERLPSQLSGGQQQRAALARALVIKPDVLLLDEPLSNLDAKLRHEMRLEIHRIQRQAGTTAIYVTHDQEEALSVADRLAVLRDGRVEQVGTPREVYHRPRSRFVADFIGETNFLTGRVVGTEKEFITIETDHGLCRGIGDAARLSVGDCAVCSVRPESMHPTDAASNVNSVTGTLERVTYLGDRDRYEVRIGDRLFAVNVVAPTAPPPSPGAAVRLGWDPAAAVIIEDD